MVGDSRRGASNRIYWGTCIDSGCAIVTPSSRTLAYSSAYPLPPVIPITTIYNRHITLHTPPQATAGENDSISENTRLGPPYLAFSFRGVVAQQLHKNKHAVGGLPHLLISGVQKYPIQSVHAPPLVDERREVGKP